MTHFEPTWESLQQQRVPEWFHDAKFGIFIHWGIYSVPALMDEWYPRHMYREGSACWEYHRETYGPDFGYKDFIPMFKGEHFDPIAWARLFRDAGAKYVVPVAEHHDGFAMYDCSLTRWKATLMGPRRDVIGDLAEAVRGAGMIFGLSSHRAEHWWFMNGGMAHDSDVRDPSYADFYGPAMPSPETRTPEWDDPDWRPRPDAAFLEDWLARTTELVDNYRPQLIYFDWWIHQLAFKPYLQRFAAHYFNRAEEWRRGVLITDKLGAFAPGVAVLDVERGQLSGIRSEPWQTCTSVSRNSWGYIGHHVYKEPGEIVHDLIDIVSKNGCLLLNVGPKPDGTIPDEEQAILRKIGQWLSINGEAIYGTRPWRIFGEGPTFKPQGAFTDLEATPFTNADWRFTTKGHVVYAICLGEPDALADIRSLNAELIESIQLLGMDAPLASTQDADGLHIQVPAEKPGKHAWTFKIELK
jgi:alpha-L-fucosidase